MDKASTHPTTSTPHFEFLMGYEGEEDVCKCRFCSKTGNSARKATPRSSSKPAVSKPKALGIRGRPPLKRGPVDDEGSPDIIKRLLSVLQQEGHIDRRVEERSNMVTIIDSYNTLAYMSQDWRVETVVYKGARQFIISQHSFVPRIGELVLFHRGEKISLHSPRAKPLHIESGKESHRIRCIDVPS